MSTASAFEFGLDTGEAKGNDKGCAQSFDVKLLDGRVLLGVKNALRQVE